MSHVYRYVDQVCYCLSNAYDGIGLNKSYVFQAHSTHDSSVGEHMSADMASLGYVLSGGNLNRPFTENDTKYAHSDQPLAAGFSGVMNFWW